MSTVSFTKKTLQYPVFSACWDNNGRYLVVGGGGGSGRSGVSNKITVLESSRTELDTIAEIELSRDEDSVTCLANLATKDGLIVYAGINSSEADRLAGKNEHFRSFIVEYPPRKPTDKGGPLSEGKISFLSKSRLFKTPASEQSKRDVYQRILRLSHPRRSTTGNKRIGAVASSLAGDSNEITIFNATTSSPKESDIIQRITPPKGAEANDADFTELEEELFQFAYCTDYEVYTSEIRYDFQAKKLRNKLSQPRTMYTVPHPDAFEKPGRLKIRSLRWISPQHIILLANLPNRSGVELLVLTMYSNNTPGSITQRRRLPKHVKAAVDFDVCLLDEDETTGERQVVIAVAGIDISLSIFTMDYKGTDRNNFGYINPLQVLRDVHPLQTTKITWSPFFSPWPSTEIDTKKNKDQTKKAPGPQHICLASTSLGNTVVVDTFKLSLASEGRPRSRYVMAGAGSNVLYKSFTVFVTAFVLLISLVLAQSFIDIWGTGEIGAGQLSIIPESIRRVASQLQAPGDRAQPLRTANMASEVKENSNTPVIRASYRLRDILENHGKHGSTKAIVVRDSPDSDLSTEVHPDQEALLQEESQVKKWEELTIAEKERWKKRLSDAGEWAVEQGETVLKGIFFGEYAGFVGHIAHAAMGE